MPQSSKKRLTTKKKVAPASAEVVTEEFDDWADSLKTVNARCSICRHDSVAQTVRALLDAMIRKRAYKITILDIRNAVLRKHPDADVGQRGLERHLRLCERDLYFRARGRRNG